MWGGEGGDSQTARARLGVFRKGKKTGERDEQRGKKEGKYCDRQGGVEGEKGPPAKQLRNSICLEENTRKRKKNKPGEERTGARLSGAWLKSARANQRNKTDQHDRKEGNNPRSALFFSEERGRATQEGSTEGRVK